MGPKSIALTKSNPDTAWLVVFAKEPKVGLVKTRLSPSLSDLQCLRLYQAFLKDTYALCQQVRCQRRILAFTGVSSSPAFLKKTFKTFSFYRQIGKDLGARMHAAFRWAYEQGAGKIVLVGSDAPTLPAGFVQQAFAELKRADVVIGPSLDGGYYLIGLTKPCPGLFKHVDWSTDQVLTQTVNNAKRLGLSLYFLPRWYDVDDRKSIQYLKKEFHSRSQGGAGAWTRRILRNLRVR